MAYLVPQISITQNLPFSQIAQITTVAGTVTGTAGFGSSLFLQRQFLPGAMDLSEMNMAVGMAFAATSNGAGTVSKSLVIYSFGNSTSLASVASVSGSSAWSIGTTTSAGATSLTQFQGGWAGSVLQAFTFASTAIQPGDYVIGVLMNFAQGSSTWTVSLFGGTGEAIVSAGVAASIHTATGSVAAISNSVTAAVSIVTTAASLAITNVEATTTAASATAAPGSAIARTVWTGATGLVTRTVFSGALTAANALSSGGFSAVTALTAANNAAPPNFAYIGNGAASATLPSAFVAGIMSTGAVPVSIAFSAAALTMSGSKALVQPWFALIGA